MDNCDGLQTFIFCLVPTSHSRRYWFNRFISI